MKKISITTCLWGNWHLDCYTQFNIPSLLNPNNLPYLSSKSNCEYIIATNTDGEKILKKNKNLIKLQKFIDVKFNIISEANNIPVREHVNWYNKFIEYSSERNSLSLFIPPDVIWSNSSLKNMLNILNSNKISGICMPYLRVISEIIFKNLQNKKINYTSEELVELAINSLHPISISIIKTISSSRPSLEKLWVIDDDNLILRNCVRELLIFDPRKVKASHIWYPEKFTKDNPIYQVTNSNEILFVSLAPFFKDMNLYLPNFEISELEIAKQTLHPLNDMDSIDTYSNIDILLSSKNSKKNRDRESKIFFNKVVQKRNLIKLYRKIRDLKVNKNFLQFLGHLIISDNYLKIFDEKKFNVVIYQRKKREISINDIYKTDYFISNHFFSDDEINNKESFSQQNFNMNKIKTLPIKVNEFKIFEIK